MTKDTRIIIRDSKNETPEEEIAGAIAPLVAEGFRVVSATTAMTPYGKWIKGTRFSGGVEIVGGSAKHVYYVTTVVLEKD